jgi:hypothetical protein
MVTSYSTQQAAQGPMRLQKGPTELFLPKIQLFHSESLIPKNMSLRIGFSELKKGFRG